MTSVARQVEFKIVPGDSMSIIGSNSKNVKGELYTLDLSFNLDDIYYRRNKRMFDIVFSFIFLILSPVMIWFQKDKKYFLINMISCLFGLKSLIGYNLEDPKYIKLPPLKNGIISLICYRKKDKARMESLHKINLIYAKNYTVYKDFDILWNRIRYLGNL